MWFFLYKLLFSQPWAYIVKYQALELINILLKMYFSAIVDKRWTKQLFSIKFVVASLPEINFQNYFSFFANCKPIILKAIEICSQLRKLWKIIDIYKIKAPVMGTKRKQSDKMIQVPLMEGNVHKKLYFLSTIYDHRLNKLQIRLQGSCSWLSELQNPEL